MDKEVLGGKKEYLVFIGVLLGVYVGFKYISPLVTPFLLAFCFVALVHPSLEMVQKKFHIKKGFLTAAFLFILFLGVGLLVWLIAMWVLKELGSLLGMLDVFENRFGTFLQDCCDGIEGQFGLDSKGIETFILEKVNLFIENFQIQIVPKLMNESVGYMKNLIGIISFMAIVIIAAVLLAKDYGEILNKLNQKEELKGLLVVGKKVFVHIGTFIKAQFVILLTISILSVSVLTLSGIEGGFFLGVFTGVMDMLPFIGTGLVLIPLAFWQILSGSYTKAAIIFVLYVGCALTREFLEPKLIGKKVGVYPVAILFSVYAGVKLFGVTGILKGPLALIAIYEIIQYRKEKNANVKEEEIIRD